VFPLTGIILKSGNYKLGAGVCQLKIDTLVKSPDAALRFILRHCGVQQVRLISSDLRALPANFLRACLKNMHFPIPSQTVSYDPASAACIR
jgi:hypothetical protein